MSRVLWQLFALRENASPKAPHGRGLRWPTQGRQARSREAGRRWVWVYEEQFSDGCAWSPRRRGSRRTFPDSSGVQEPQCLRQPRCTRPGRMLTSDTWRGDPKRMETRPRHSLAVLQGLWKLEATVSAASQATCSNLEHAVRPHRPPTYGEIQWLCLLRKRDRKSIPTPSFLFEFISQQGKLSCCSLPSLMNLEGSIKH